MSDYEDDEDVCEGCGYDLNEDGVCDNPDCEYYEVPEE